MPEQHPGSAPVPQSLPDNPNLDWLREQAKGRLEELRGADPAAQLADAQFEIAKQYGFSSWRALEAHIDSLTVDGQLFDAARNGDINSLTALLDKHPDKLHARAKPYEWSLLHAAARNGHLAVVDELLKRGLDVNVRERGDNTYAMHRAAAGGHLDIVRRLADEGGDVVGHGDDHEAEVIGWAASAPECDDAAHRAVADFLVSRGARHHISSAIAMNRADELRRIVADDPSALKRRQSRNENHRTPLHVAVLMNRQEMIALLLELGADPLAVDGSRHPVAFYASTPDADRRVMESGCSRTARISTAAGRARGAEVTPLHLAAARGHLEMVRLLLGAGADPTVRDSTHDDDAIGWAEHFRQPEIVQLLKDHPV